MNKIKPFIPSIAIVLVGIILGGSYLIVTIIKQNSFEKQNQITVKNSRASRANQCIKDAESKAITRFHIECINNPDVGGSPEKCDIAKLGNVIGYIEYGKGISFEMFQNAEQLTEDRATCARLYGN